MANKKFQCGICQVKEFESCEIVTLKCQHSYCWICMKSYVNDNLEGQIKCPNANCSNLIHDDIIRQSLPDFKIDEYEYKSVSFAIRNENKNFKCLLPECGNLVLVNDNIQFECSSCLLFNCVSCNATHPYMNCTKYQETKKNSLNSKESKEKFQMIEDEEFTKARNKLKELRGNQINLNMKRFEDLTIISNNESFTCPICLKVIRKGNGIKLRFCFHDFCKNCLKNHIKNSANIPVTCLESNCKGTLQDREIRGIVSKSDFDRYLDKCLTVAKSKLQDVYHCKKPNCKFYGIVNGNLNSFICPSCKSENCIKCTTIHKPGETCEQYQLLKMNGDNVDLKTLQFIENQIVKGDMMKCPTCGCLVEKKGGCNWVKCPECKLELCWVLKIPRWGPNGNGDTSGGCRCLVNKKPCHPTCTLGCMPEN